MPLRWARYGKRAVDPEVLALMIDRVHRTWRDVSTAPIADQGIVAPRIPKCEYSIDKFFCARIAPIVPGHCVEPMIARLGVEHGGDYVPADAATRDVIERG